MAMADIKQILADPDFGKLSLKDQKDILSRVDPDFGKLSDQDFAQMVGQAGGVNPSPGQFHPTKHMDSLKGTRDLTKLPPVFPAMAKQGENEHLNLEDTLGAASEMARLVATAAAPAALPALIGMGGMAIPAVAGGMAAQQAGDTLGEMTGHEGYGHALGDIGGLAAGYGISKLNPEGVLGAAKGLYKGLGDVPVLGKVLKVPEAMYNGYMDAVHPAAPSRPVVAPPPVAWHPPAATPEPVPPPPVQWNNRFSPQTRPVVAPPPVQWRTPAPQPNLVAPPPIKWNSGPPLTVKGSTPVAGASSSPVPPVGESVPEIPMTWSRANNLLHSTLQQMELPGIPAGTRAPAGTVSGMVKSVFGKTIHDLNPEEMGKLNDFIVKNKRLPTAGDPL